ncbi:hypothetical protein HN958_00970 [Candidatus Falkowbacteria bacterium]|jgi:hypothetical protein|nr:hypothetical protein [Candidatus Falkowbacteria bacterium]MBT7007063.1 hypothetical protein [Candidatus Falkowbacteria bacterium]
MNKKVFKITVIILISGAILWLAYFMSPFSSRGMSKAEIEVRRQQYIKINELINTRKQAQAVIDDTDDPFGDDGIVRVLLIGLDSRVGQENGHCDAIQFIDVNLNNNSVQITAVPRGTYSPLPGSGHLPSDYYVSKSCEIGGLEYGINQMERIAEKKADYVVLVGFSEVIGILRKLNLPATETLQWLRHRQGYGVGEPQRAHNHSTFIKQQMLKFLPDEKSKLDIAWQYLVYKLLNTDMSFSEARIVIDKLIMMDLADNPNKITLEMRPNYKLVEIVEDEVSQKGEGKEDGIEEKDVEPIDPEDIVEINGKMYQKVYYDILDIKYDEEIVDEYLLRMLNPIKDRLDPDDYGDITDQEAQDRVIDSIKEGMKNDLTVAWLYDNNVWYQIDDKSDRLNYQYQIVEKYLDTVDNSFEKESIITDYILEMEYLNAHDFVEKGRALLELVVFD